METLAAKRKAEEAEAAALLPQKRVVLGELPHLSNMVHPEVLASGLTRHTPKSKAKPKSKKSKGKARRTIVTEKGTEKGRVEDPRLAVAYASDIDDYLRQLEIEVKRRPSTDYLVKVQEDMTPYMRGILVDWLVEVAQEFMLPSETLFLAVSYIDRYLSSHLVQKKMLQLLGVCTMFIASKYEEISPPGVGKFCDIADNIYTKDQLLTMEADILKSFKFELGTPTVFSFLQRFSAIALDTQKVPNFQFEFLSHYLSELSLLDFDCVQFLPSLVAASVIFLARFIICPKREPWSTKLKEFTGYPSAELKKCVLILHDLYLGRRGGSHPAIRDKYKQHEFKFVTLLPSPPEVPLYFFGDPKMEMAEESQTLEMECIQRIE